MNFSYVCEYCGYVNDVELEQDVCIECAQTISVNVSCAECLESTQINIQQGGQA